MWATLDPRMVYSSRHGWTEVRSTHPTPRRLFFTLVLPFSLVPALMLLYAGHTHADALVQGSTLVQWQIAAAVFLLAELFTVPLMARLLGGVLGKDAPDFDACFALAAYAAIPLWLSSLGLFSSEPMTVAVFAMIGLGASFATLFHGLTAFFAPREEMLESQYYAWMVLAAGGCAWLLLIALLGLMLGVVGM
ncbi:MAG TPA: YIP1 family protein [Roseateles sp.]|nr:YIP1 family protein [Roseateles sp.]HWT54820.1 YIP1 family protein [Rhodocyclaceae bacterium]